MMRTSSGILQSYLLKAFKEQEPLDPQVLLEMMKKPDALKISISEGGVGFVSSLNYYLSRLDEIDPILIPYMPQEKRDELEHNLQITVFLLSTQTVFEQQRQKDENKQLYDGLLEKCNGLLDALNPKIQERIHRSPEQAYFSDGKPVKYCGIALAQEFCEQLLAWTEHKSKKLKEALGALNEKRLYWIWASVLLKTVLSQMSADFFNLGQASDAIKAPDPYTGCLSWTLYYFRFSLNLYLLLKHTFVAEDSVEAQMPMWDRFLTQWKQRKFTLLNDSLWGTANLLCFFWLNGKSALGTWGDAVTIILLVFDLSVALWDFAEQETEHNRKLQQFEEDIWALHEAMAELQQQEADSDQRKRKLQQMQMQINALEDEKKKCKRDWELQKLNLYNNVAYALGLLGSFTVLTMPFVPMTAATAMTMGIVGAVLCFAFTVMSSAVRGGIEIHKARTALQEAREDFQIHVQLLQDKLNKTPDLTDNEKKFLYLEIKRLQLKSEYEKQMVVLQSVHLVRSIIIEALVPAVIFACLVFCPLGIGLGAMGAALGLAIASNILINKLFTPDERLKELPEFDEVEYTRFCTAIQKTNTNPYTFFKQKDKAGLHYSPAEQNDNLASDGEEASCVFP